MNFNRHIWTGLFASLAGCVLFAGCQVARQQTTHHPAPMEAAPTLNTKQQADLQFAFARLLEKSGSLDQAKSAYEDALKKDPQRADALDRLAVMNARKGQFEQAIDLHKKAIVLQPRNADFVCNLGYSYYLQQRWAEAEMQFRKAIELTPNQGRALNNLGMVLARTVRPDEALAAFRRSGCTEADAHSNLAFALTLENSLKEAHQHFARARTLDPGSELAEDGLRVVNAQLNGPDKTSTAAYEASPKTAGPAPLASPVAAPVIQPPIVMPEPGRLPARINAGLEAPISMDPDSPSSQPTTGWVTNGSAPTNSKMDPSDR